MSWLGEFFRAIPDVVRAVWTFSEGLLGLGVAVGSAVLIVVLFALTLRTREDHGWVAAVLGGMGATIGAWWLFGILPSAWVYFADSNQPLLADTVVPSQIVIGDLQIATNFFQVFRDSVVMGETIIAMGALAVAALLIQKRYPRGLAAGEERGPTSGGYK